MVSYPREHRAYCYETQNCSCSHQIHCKQNQNKEARKSKSKQGSNARSKKIGAGLARSYWAGMGPHKSVAQQNRVLFDQTSLCWSAPLAHPQWSHQLLGCSLHLRCIQPTVFLSHTKPVPATSTNQPAVLFSYKKSAPATSTSQPNTAYPHTHTHPLALLAIVQRNSWYKKPIIVLGRPSLLRAVDLLI